MPSGVRQDFWCFLGTKDELFGGQVSVVYMPTRLKRFTRPTVHDVTRPTVHDVMDVKFLNKTTLAIGKLTVTKLSAMKLTSKCDYVE